MRRSSQLLAAVLMLLLAPNGMAQTAASDPRRAAPTEQLSRLDRFLGRYTTVMEQSNRRVPGTMELKPVVKGFYIERVNLSATADGKVDSEIRSLITWDPELAKYRIWRFVPLTPQKRLDGIAWFDGDVFIEEYPIEGSATGQRLLRNRVTMSSPDEMRIVNEIEYADGKTSTRGIIHATRMK